MLGECCLGPQIPLFSKPNPCLKIFLVVLGNISIDVLGGFLALDFARFFVGSLFWFVE